MATRKKNFLKIVILGDSGVGKTTLLQQYLNGKVTGQSKPTIGADFSKKEILIDNTVVTLQIWDTAGQEKFQSLGYAFYRGADCCALTYDMTNQTSFENLDRWKRGFLENAGPNDPLTFPFVCLGNKLDQAASRQVPTVKGEQWAKDNDGMMFYETSALDGVNVENAFRDMARAALKREAQQQITMPTSIENAGGSLKLNQKTEAQARNQTKQSSSCC